MSKAIRAIGAVFRPRIPEVARQSMPDPGSFAARLAARRKVRMRARKRGGRDATIYTGQTYSGSNLGGTR